MIYSNRLLILAIDSKTYLMEYYNYGGGVFWGLPYTDTLTLVKGRLLSNKHVLTIGADRLTIKSRGGKKKFKYQILDKCDSSVNWTRNWPMRESIRYKIKDRLKSQEFSHKSEPLLRTVCHDDFMIRMTEIKKEI